ncbi:hypothetical protein RchiOBHm_Chr2g0131911 [Rosa chinensis]|uniref:Uncharacterized protein n=1 Tax=Rosa chinensis TaxID=74649 RepID=A0A2P6RV70_ROSCH|nr:hypothetical protein RchiOBHm_Chr2g0131911 [Rosa chinensis]
MLAPFLIDFNTSQNFQFFTSHHSTKTRARAFLSLKITFHLPELTNHLSLPLSLSALSLPLNKNYLSLFTAPIFFLRRTG